MLFKLLVACALALAVVADLAPLEAYGHAESGESQLAPCSLLFLWAWATGFTAALPQLASSTLPLLLGASGSHKPQPVARTAPASGSHAQQPPPLAPHTPCAPPSPQHLPLPALIEKVDITGDGGIVKYIVQKGEGAQAKKGAQIAAHYDGKLVDGKQFDSSRKRGQPFKFGLGAFASCLRLLARQRPFFLARPSRPPLSPHLRRPPSGSPLSTGGGQVIKGWDMGFVGMQVGEKAILCVCAWLPLAASPPACLRARARARSATASRGAALSPPSPPPPPAGSSPRHPFPHPLARAHLQGDQARVWLWRKWRWRRHPRRRQAVL
jgi:hypothetical protein